MLPKHPSAPTIIERPASPGIDFPTLAFRLVLLSILSAPVALFVGWLLWVLLALSAIESFSLVPYFA